MKKILITLVVAVAIAACNNAADTSGNSDSTNNMNTVTPDTTSNGNMTDTTSHMDTMPH